MMLHEEVSPADGQPDMAAPYDGTGPPIPVANLPASIMIP